MGKSVGKRKVVHLPSVNTGRSGGWQRTMCGRKVRSTSVSEGLQPATCESCLAYDFWLDLDDLDYEDCFDADLESVRRNNPPFDDAVVELWENTDGTFGTDDGEIEDDEADRPAIFEMAVGDLKKLAEDLGSRARYNVAVEALVAGLRQYADGVWEVGGPAVIIRIVRDGRAR